MKKGPVACPNKVLRPHCTHAAQRGSTLANQQS